MEKIPFPIDRKRSWYWKVDWKRKAKPVRKKRRTGSGNCQDWDILQRGCQKINECIHEKAERNTGVFSIRTLKGCSDDQRRSHEKIWFFWPQK